MRSFWRALIDAYTREDSSDAQKITAFTAICDLFNVFYEEEEIYIFEGEEADRILGVCMKEITRQRATNSVPVAKIAELSTECLRQAQDRSSGAQFVLSDNVIWEWIYVGIQSDDGDAHLQSATLLARIINYAHAPDLISIIIRHYECLLHVIETVFNKKQALPEFWEYAFDSRNAMHGVLARLPRLFCRWASAFFHRDCHRLLDSDRAYCDEAELCVALLHTLDQSIDSPAVLDGLLSNGVLVVSRHFAGLPVPQATPHPAAVFSRILQQCPHWNEMFRRWTIAGPQGNPTADLGRSIRPRRPRGALFIIAEEDGQL